MFIYTERLLRLVQGERNYIMQVVCEATQNAAVPVQVGAFECLVKIMSLYYDKMNYYMERALFGVCCIDSLSSASTDVGPLYSSLSWA